MLPRSICKAALRVARGRGFRPIFLMNNNLGFVVKVLVLSSLLSVLIKYAGPYLSLEATNINALIIVLLPNVMIAIALLWRFQSSLKQN